MKIVKSWQEDFSEVRRFLHERGNVDYSGVEKTVRKIIDDVRARGDEALIELSERFDGVRLTTKSIRTGSREIEKAYGKVDKATIDLIEEAATRIRDFHREQVRRSWHIIDKDGNLMGQNIVPVRAAGLYVPGGTAAYPSSLLMNAVPAQVAGVGRLVVCTPATEGKINPLVLVTADLLGIDEIYKVGGAQAVAAMAYGTESIAAVDIIVGPGNIYVASAKRAVYGRVNIDMIAGPSEIFIVADKSADPSYIAADLLSQAEHDKMATCVLLTDSEYLAREVDAELEKQLEDLPRKEVAESSLRERGRIIIVRSIDEAFRLMEEFAPEHLEVLVAEPARWLNQVKYCGSAFFGPYTPEALGDYLAGPNHVLPTGGAARFSSPLGVYNFLVHSNVLYFQHRGLKKLASKVIRFAELEGLKAHARSVQRRNVEEN